ncbi:hypothetical protein BLNAU_20322 [Blattamonas nauphoetae]|uniref:Uncharacterized protein n=1 Tax=Blattamonas nauphoetae TaxID=2049346 RepID=A0ABQ9WZ58_9EUKA|nr:hypothetical protein BLNAU_20322 [Blattamonas nauphoetae]
MHFTLDIIETTPPSTPRDGVSRNTSRNSSRRQSILGLSQSIKQEQPSQDHQETSDPPIDNSTEIRQSTLQTLSSPNHSLRNDVVDYQTHSPLFGQAHATPRSPDSRFSDLDATKNQPSLRAATKRTKKFHLKKTMFSIAPTSTVAHHPNHHPSPLGQQKRFYAAPVPLRTRIASTQDLKVDGQRIHSVSSLSTLNRTFAASHPSPTRPQTAFLTRQPQSSPKSQKQRPLTAFSQPRPKREQNPNQVLVKGLSLTKEKSVGTVWDSPSSRQRKKSNQQRFLTLDDESLNSTSQPPTPPTTRPISATTRPISATIRPTSASAPHTTSTLHERGIPFKTDLENLQPTLLTQLSPRQLNSPRHTRSFGHIGTLSSSFTSLNQTIPSPHSPTHPTLTDPFTVQHFDSPLMKSHSDRSHHQSPSKTRTAQKRTGLVFLSPSHADITQTSAPVSSRSPAPTATPQKLPRGIQIQFKPGPARTKSNTTSRTSSTTHHSPTRTLPPTDPSITTLSQADIADTVHIISSTPSRLDPHSDFAAVTRVSSYRSPQHRADSASDALASPKQGLSLHSSIITLGWDRASASEPHQINERREADNTKTPPPRRTLTPPHTQHTFTQKRNLTICRSLDPALLQKLRSSLSSQKKKAEGNRMRDSNPLP